MKQEKRYDFEGLRTVAEDAVRLSKKKRKVVAAELGVAPSSITNALKRSGSKFSSLQQRIIEHLTDYTVTETITFQMVKKK